MSILIKKEFVADLDKPISSIRFAEPLYFADALAHEFTVRVKHGSTAEPLTGATVTAYFIRADNATVVIDGTVTDGAAVVTLPSSCYMVNGGWRLAVRAVSGAVKQTILLLEGAVQNTTTDSVVDPSHVIPSLDDLLAQIAVMEAATAECVEATEECVEAKALIEGMTVSASEAAAPSAVVSTVDDHYHIEFGLKNGEDGDAATIAVGTVTTLPAGSQATVVNAGTSAAAVLNFGIPKGADGTGAGDMTKSVYDTNDNGKVDTAEDADHAAEADHAESADEATRAESADALDGHPVSYFMTNPAAEGTAGQVLTTDGEGGRSWATPQSGGGVGENLLINPWFTINQREITTYTVGKYGVDRWKLVSGSATVTNNGITLNGTLRQIRENSLWRSGLFASVKMYSGTATATYDDTTKYFDIVSNGGTIRAAKLEIGASSTIGNEAISDYSGSVELLKCQRYLYPFPNSSANSAYIAAYAFSTTSIRGSVPTPVQMRTDPTALFTVGDVSKFRAIGNGTSLVPSALITIRKTLGSSLTIEFTVSGAAQNYTYVVSGSYNDVRLFFDAEL